MTTSSQLARVEFVSHDTLHFLPCTRYRSRGGVTDELSRVRAPQTGSICRPSATSRPGLPPPSWLHACQASKDAAEARHAAPHAVVWRRRRSALLWPPLLQLLAPGDRLRTQGLRRRVPPHTHTPLHTRFAAWPSVTLPTHPPTPQPPPACIRFLSGATSANRALESSRHPSTSKILLALSTLLTGTLCVPVPCFPPKWTEMQQQICTSTYTST